MRHVIYAAPAAKAVINTLVVQIADRFTGFSLVLSRMDELAAAKQLLENQPVRDQQ